jgi:hypothetical protein
MCATNTNQVTQQNRNVNVNNPRFGLLHLLISLLNCSIAFFFFSYYYYYYYYYYFHISFSFFRTFTPPFHAQCSALGAHECWHWPHPRQARLCPFRLLFCIVAYWILLVFIDNLRYLPPLRNPPPLPSPNFPDCAFPPRLLWRTIRTIPRFHSAHLPTEPSKQNHNWEIITKLKFLVRLTFLQRNMLVWRFGPAILITGRLSMIPRYNRIGAPNRFSAKSRTRGTSRLWNGLKSGMLLMVVCFWSYLVSI